MSMAETARRARQPSVVAKELGAVRKRLGRSHLHYTFSDGSVLQTSGHGKSYITWLGEGDNARR